MLSAAVATGDILPDAIRSDWGPFYSELEAPGGHLRRRALGPLLEHAESSGGHRFWALRPLVSRIGDEADRRTRVEVLWPLGIGRRLDDQSSLRLLTAWFVDWDVHDDQSPYRLWILPIYFQGRSQHDQGYLALFPLGGSIKEFLGRDDITFGLFPLTARITFEDLETIHLLWPFFKRATNDEIDRLRVFPFYQHNRIEGRHDKTSILWPVWTSVEYTHPRKTGQGYLLFPLGGRLRLNDEETWMVIPPLFRYTNGQTLDRLYVPYPFFQFSSGEVEKRYVLPLWGSETTAGSHTSFVLWPIFWRMHISKVDAVTTRTLALPVLYLTKTRERTFGDEGEGDVRRRDAHLWPLFSYRRRGETAVTRALDLWPPSWRGPIERNYAPFWSLFVRTRVEDTALEEALWGMYRRYRRGDEEQYLSVFPFFQYHREGTETAARSFSLLKGLVGYRRTEHGSSWRLLYAFRFGDGDDSHESP